MKRSRESLHRLVEVFDEHEADRPDVEISAVIMVFTPKANKPKAIVYIGDIEDLKVELDNTKMGTIMRYHRDLTDVERNNLVEDIKAIE